MKKLDGSAVSKKGQEFACDPFTMPRLALEAAATEVPHTGAHFFKPHIDGGGGGGGGDGIKNTDSTAVQKKVGEFVMETASPVLQQLNVNHSGGGTQVEEESTADNGIGKVTINASNTNTHLTLS